MSRKALQWMAMASVYGMMHPNTYISNAADKIVSNIKPILPLRSFDIPEDKIPKGHKKERITLTFETHSHVLSKEVDITYTNVKNRLKRINSYTREIEEYIFSSLPYEELIKRNEFVFAPKENKA